MTIACLNRHDLVYYGLIICLGLGSLSLSLNSSTMEQHSLGVLAMCCINELLSKNCVPQEFEEFLLQMFQQTFYLLQRITKDSTTTSTGNKLSELEER